MPRPRLPSVRYPDGMVVCAPAGVRDTVVTEPAVIFEILSPSTSRTDRIIKNHEYAATPSVCRYVMLEQDTIAATVFARDGGDWVGHIMSADAILAFPEIDLSLPLAELYDGLDVLVEPDEAD